MLSPNERGRLLERRVARYLSTLGYQVACNELVEGRTGGMHEIDVLARRTDALTTIQLAVECKAWQKPIEKDVVGKLDLVLRDAGLNKGIIVSLSGSRAGAERHAADLGIELWGPDELRHHLGDSAFAELEVPNVDASSTLSWGKEFAIDTETAERTIRAAGRGRFGIRTTEELTWFSWSWLPAYYIMISLTRSETKRRGAAMTRSYSFGGLYDALVGSYLGDADPDWIQMSIPNSRAVGASVRPAKVEAKLRQAFKAYERVTSESAILRHQANLADLGIPTPCTSLTVDRTFLVYLPIFTGLLSKGRGQRVVAVYGKNGMVSDRIGQLLTENICMLRTSPDTRPAS